MYITLNSVNQSLLTAVRLTCDERVTDKKSHPLVNISCESGAVYVTNYNGFLWHLRYNHVKLPFRIPYEEATPLGGCFLPGECFLPGGASSGGCLMETPRDGYCCGRYAFCWNAFLLKYASFYSKHFTLKSNHAKGQLKRILWIVYFHPHITGTNPDFIFIPEDSPKTQMDVVVKNVCQIGQPTFSLFFSHSNIWLMNEQLGGTEEQ